MVSKIFPMGLLVMVLCVGVNIAAAGKSYTYQSTTKGVTVNYMEKVETEKDKIILTGSYANGNRMQTVCSPDFSTQTWEFINPRQDIHIRAERQGNIIKLQGRFKGKEVSQEYKINKRPWYQAWSFSLGAFAISGANKLEFFTIRDDLKEFTMNVTRQQEELVGIGGQNIEAVKVKVSLAGWMSKFWSADYWFRKTDGVLLKSEGMNGPPGTPQTVDQLAKESEI